MKIKASQLSPKLQLKIKREFSNLSGLKAQRFTIRANKEIAVEQMVQDLIVEDSKALEIFTSFLKEVIKNLTRHGLFISDYGIENARTIRLDIDSSAGISKRAEKELLKIEDPLYSYMNLLQKTKNIYKFIYGLEISPSKHEILIEVSPDCLNSNF
jgi:hypothetical protein